MKLERGARVHFVGVGGAGMSAIAKVLLERGYVITGSDLKAGRAQAVLQAMGARITVGHDPALPEGADMVVVSSAIPNTNVELRRARELGIHVLTRGEALAEVLSGDRPIVVAGTHGKTTMTSMIIAILRSAGRDPTYLVGGGLNDAGTNARSGRDDIAVAESDESDGSFLLLQPWVSVVTNVEADHLDHWGSLEALEDGFDRFVAATQAGGGCVLPNGDSRRAALAAERGLKVLTFGPGAEVVPGPGAEEAAERADVTASEVATSGGAVAFSLSIGGAGSTAVTLRVPGMHNVANALAAAAACTLAGLSAGDIAVGLSAYRGVERRFQVKGEQRGVRVIDDYAHHPTEVRAVLAAARSSIAPGGRVVAVFQPHRFSRTKALSEMFGSAFADADRIVITDVYGAGEMPVPGVSGKVVADAVAAHLPRRALAYLPHRDELIGFLRASARSGDSVLTMGAGDITSVGDELLELLAEEPAPTRTGA